MTKTKQISIIFLLTIISLLFAGIAVAEDWFFAYTDTPDNFICSSTRVYSTDGAVSYSLPNGALVTTSEILNGGQYASNTSPLSGTASHSFPVLSTRFSSDYALPYTYTVSYTVKVDDAVVSQSSLSVRCNEDGTATVIANTLSFAGGEEVGVASPPDARFNWGAGDSNIAIIYPNGESIGLYLYAGEQYFYDFVTAADLEPFVDNPPTENTLIASAGGVSVYVLTTGEISFIIGPDAEGKQYAVIMSDLSGSDSYSYEL